MTLDRRGQPAESKGKDDQTSVDDSDATSNSVTQHRSKIQKRSNSQSTMPNTNTQRQRRSSTALKKQPQQQSNGNTTFLTAWLKPKETMQPVHECPVCSASISGPISALERHVNECLDSPCSISKPTVTDTQPDSGNEASVPPHPQPQLQPQLQKQTQRQVQISQVSQTSQTSQSHNFIELDDEDEKVITGRPAGSGSGASSTAKRARSRVRQCPLHKLIPNTSISVDAFNLGAISGCTAYFLSHFHSDHYGGLTSAWSHGPVYCNAITAALVRTQLKVDANLVVELPMNSWTTIQHCPNTMVYLFDANHAPGSAIFVFLIGTDSASDDTLPLVAGHTGDFRATYQHLQDIEVALSTAPVTDPSRLCIDWLYLDTTYFSDEYVFPLQEDVLSTVSQIASMIARDPASLAKHIDMIDKTRFEDNKATILDKYRKSSGSTNSSSNNIGKSDSTISQDSGVIPPSNPTSSTSSTSSTSHTLEEIIRSQWSPANHSTLLSQSTVQTAQIPQLPSDTRVLFVVGTYIIGKERVAESILTALDAVYGDRSLIYGDDKKCNLLKLLDGHPITADRLTNNPHIARVHIVSLVNITAKGMQQYSKTFGRMFDGIVAFKPTGWTFTQNFSSAKTATKANASSTAMRGDEFGFPKRAVFGLEQLNPSFTTYCRADVGNKRNVPKKMTKQRSLFSFIKSAVAKSISVDGEDDSNSNSTAEPFPKVTIFPLPYSEHSSFRDHALFAAGISRPIKRVVPTVSMKSVFRDGPNMNRDVVCSADEYTVGVPIDDCGGAVYEFAMGDLEERIQEHYVKWRSFKEHLMV